MEHLRLDAVIHVGREVRNLIGQINKLRLQRWLLVKKVGAQLRMLNQRIIPRVLDDPFAYAEGQIQPAKSGITNLEVFHDAQRVQVVVEAQSKFPHGLVQRPFAGMPEGRMPNVMHQRQRFRHVLVQLQRVGDGARNLRHFHGVGEPAAKVVGVAVSEDLRLSRQAAKRTGMNHPRPVTLKRSAVGMLRFGVLPLCQHIAARRRRRSSRAAGQRCSVNCFGHPAYCFGLAPADSSLASFTRAVSSFFCTLFTSPGSASAGTVRAYSCRLCSHCEAAIFRRPVFS